MNPEILSCYLNALANWRYSGFIGYSRIAEEWLRKHLPNLTQKTFAQLLHDYVHAGGEIDQVLETRPEWSTYTHHYDLRPTVNGQIIYVETRIDYDEPNDPDDPIITVVNIHLA